MFRYLRALWYMVTGRFGAAADALQSNKHVMNKTYDKSILKGAERFETVRNAVAQLMSIENTRIQEIKNLNGTAEKLEKIKSGSKVAMQKRIDALMAQGKTKDEIQQDPEFIKHSGNYKDASSSLDQSHQQIHDKEEDLKERSKQIAQYKVELQTMQKNHTKLKEEKSEAIADVAIAQQAQQIADILGGIAEDTTDKDLIAVREARRNAKAKAKIMTELSGNDARLAENEYLELASNSDADKELDGLLNWGEEASSKMEDAKLPE
jgi:hypothetical protein